MNAVPPSPATNARLSCDRYALSAGTSRTVKFSAVFSTNALKNGQSLASRSPTSTAVTMFVLAPQMAWALTQSWPDRSRPYLWSNQRTKRELEKPVESGAKHVSTRHSGRLLRTIKALRTGVSLSFSRKAQTETLFISEDR